MHMTDTRQAIVAPSIHRKCPCLVIADMPRRFDRSDVHSRMRATRGALMREATWSCLPQERFGRCGFQNQMDLRGSVQLFLEKTTEQILGPMSFARTCDRGMDLPGMPSEFPMPT